MFYNIDRDVQCRQVLRSIVIEMPFRDRYCVLAIEMSNVDRFYGL